MLACGADLDAANYSGSTPRQLMADRRVTFADDDAQAEAVESARREVAKLRLDFVRHRAWQVCIGLQSRGLDALPFHQWWKIATVVKHFKTN